MELTLLKSVLLISFVFLSQITTTGVSFLICRTQCTLLISRDIHYPNERLWYGLLFFLGCDQEKMQKNVALVKKRLFCIFTKGRFIKQNT